jgi:hypothetical protein
VRQRLSIQELLQRGNAEASDNQDENGAGDSLTEGTHYPKSDYRRRRVFPKG